MAKKDTWRTILGYQCDQTTVLMLNILTSVGENNPLRIIQPLADIGKESIHLVVAETVDLMKTKTITSNRGHVHLSNKMEDAVRSFKTLYTDHREIMLAALIKLHTPEHGLQKLLSDGRKKYAANPLNSAKIVEKETLLWIPWLTNLYWMDNNFVDQGDETMFKLSPEYPA